MNKGSGCFVKKDLRLKHIHGDSIQTLSHQCINKNWFMREIKMTGEGFPKAASDYDHIKLHLHVDQLLLKTTWRPARKHLLQPNLKKIHMESGRKGEEVNGSDPSP